MAKYKGHTHLDNTNVRRPFPWGSTLGGDAPVMSSTRVNPSEVERPRSQVWNRNVGKLLGNINKELDNSVIHREGGSQTFLQGNINKTWRGLIILNRLGLNPLKYADKYVFDYIDKGINYVTKPGGLQSLLSLNGKKTYDKFDSDLDSSTKEERFSTVRGRQILVGRSDMNALKNNADSQNNPLNFQGTFTLFPENNINDENFPEGQVLEDPSLGVSNKIQIYNTLLRDPQTGLMSYVELQNRPPQIDYQPQSSWADIKSMGRNVPMYHYTGSETTLQFTTSWYMPDPSTPGFNMYWVINQCRILESWTMANGYLSAPPYLFILWGDSNLFSEHLWILQSATYKLADFHDRLLIRDTQKTGKIDNLIGANNGYRTSAAKDIYTEKPQYQALINQGLVPFSATQELIFKRVAGINLWYNDIYPQLRSLNPNDIYGSRIQINE